MSAIIEMPELVFQEIIGLLDFRAVLTLRQVCRDFRNFIDRLNDSKLPDSKFKLIKIHAKVADDNENKIMFDFVDAEGSFDSIEYSESENSRKFKDKTTILENSNIVDVAIQDLEFILKFQKSILECLSFCFDDLQPDSLRKLNLHSEDNELEFEINEIVKTEQWKKAERLNCDINVLNLKTFLGSSKFEKLSLELNGFNEQEDLSNIWGEAFETVYSIIWYFRMKDCQETILMIAIQQEYISFDTIQIRYVPDGVIVHDYKGN